MEYKNERYDEIEEESSLNTEDRAKLAADLGISENDLSLGPKD